MTNARRLLPLGFCLLAVVTGCRNVAPTMPPTGDPWQAARMPQLTLGSSLSSIAFAGNHGVALGLAAAKSTTDYLLLERGSNGTWTRTTLTDPPSKSRFLDLAAGAEGIVAVGMLQQGADTCVIHDARGVAPANVLWQGFGIAAVDGDDALMVAGGSAIGGILATSRTPQFWVIATTPLDQSHEGGFTDVFVGNGEALACGFDDGAVTRQVVLRLDDSDDSWHLVPLGAGATGKTLQCVAAGDDGTMLLGGLDGADGLTPRAFAWQRGVDGIWRALTLPDGDLIGGVNDVLPAPGGVWYLACGGQGGSELATILRLQDGTIKRDLKPFVGTIAQLARAADGTICAVGWSLTEGTGLRQALLLERR